MHDVMHEAPVGLDDKSKRLLSMLAGMGAGGTLVAVLASMGGLKLSLEDRRFLEGPIVVHGNAWQHDVPKWMFPQIVGERAEIVLGLRPPTMTVGPTEIAAVMMPATFEAPFARSEIVDLYMWATCNAAAIHYRRPIKHYWQNVLGGDRPIEDKDVVLRGGRLWETYWPLANEIRRKVEGHAKAYVKAETIKAETIKPERVIVAAAPRPSKPAVTHRPIVVDNYSFKFE
jgi:hypothetical protein